MYDFLRERSFQDSSMSNELIQSPLTMDNIEVGQLEIQSNRISHSETGLLRSGMEYSSLNLSTIPNFKFDMVGAGLSDRRSQQMVMEMLQRQQMQNAAVSYELPLTYPMVGPNIPHNFNQTKIPEEQMLDKVQGQTVFPPFELSQSSGMKKRKATEISSETSISKRMIQEEHRPWLQSLLTKHHQQARSPRNTTPRFPKIYQSGIPIQPPQPVKRSTPSRVGQSASSPKESFDSVRSKLRESLSSALAMAAQSKDNDTKASNGHESSKGFPQIVSLSEDDASFTDSLFVKDDLLQGNGLSWVMESDLMLADKKITEKGIARVFENPETLSSKIEAELYKLFGGVNKKYKEKGRSLLFNLKDRSNPELAERVLSGEISPERLCSMTAEELASKELSQWRIAKAEELAQMVVLPDTDVDIRRLVKKTHKGEVQVELEEEPQNFSVQGGDKTKQQIASESAPDDTHENELMQKLDSEFLRPIVSLDEFMESLDSEPPFESSSEKKSEDGNESKSQVDVSVKSAPAVGQIEGERVWDGLLKLNVSVVSHVTAVFRSGEKTSAKEWPCLTEVKGRVRIEAFGKFLQELPLSRSRSVMVLHFMCRSGTSESDLASIREVADCYVKDERVGLAEPSPGVELYVCPPRGKTSEILDAVFPISPQAADGVDPDPDPDPDPLDCVLIGVVVWRKLASTSPKSASHHKHTSKRKHTSSRRSHPKHSSPAVPPPNPPKPPQPPPEPDDDVPPGFGPQEEDDLPEFDFASPSNRPVVAPPTRPPIQQPIRPVNEIRQLIHKYGQPENKLLPGGLVVQPWNDDDDDDDMPEWLPEHTLQPPNPYTINYSTGHAFR